MMRETIGYNVTAAATTGTAAAAMTGDSLTVKAGAPSARILLLSAWGQNQTAGAQQLVWPSAHDTTRGIRTACQAGSPFPITPPGLTAELRPQETIVPTIFGLWNAGDIEMGFLDVFYDDVPGVSGMFVSAEELMSSVEKLCTVYASITLAATGSWAGSELITAESDLLLANRRYAWIGGSASLPIGAVAMSAPDWGGVRIAVPGTSGADLHAADYHLNLAWLTGLKVIPVFNSGNRGNINLSAVDDENGAATVCSYHLALLKE